MNTADKGCLTEAILTAELLKRRLVVLKPVHAHARYDLVIERCGKFERVQCKTGHYRNGAVHFKCCSMAGSAKLRSTRNYVGDADLFLVYCYESNKVYLVPVEDTGNTNARLRVEPTKNNQEKNVLWAKDYEI